MATYSPLNPNAVSPHSFWQDLMPSEPFGIEGQALVKKLIKVNPKVTQDEPIKRLLQSLEWNIQKHQEERQEELQHYLDSLRLEARATEEAEFTVSVINTAWQVWEKLRKHFLKQSLCLEVPDACPGKSDNFMYTWSRGEHYFECEIFGNSEVEFFYRNRNSSELWGEDTTLEKEFSTDIFAKASIFT
ncbi:hypothetical protein H6F74_26690 [Trichocoleus sp. FACHB-90]|uniref:hypothetical protein n=1 Tax=Cyanophyceae TaxID=3028117 RepID=UPI00168A2109|nr:hypothetical protein [Trichocoleus sp. FACHB-90]MBD1929794.1 hypothetical protein [Trichocoleus sp. FACHB-90]